MFSKKKKVATPQNEKRKNELSGMLGLGVDPGDMTGLGFGDMDDNDDDDLEAELAALQGGGQRKPQKKKKKALPMADIEKMAADSLKDIDDNEDIDDDDLDDPDLLAELQCIGGGDELAEDDPTPVMAVTPAAKTTEPASSPGSGDLATLLEREKMYKVAMANAEKDGQSSKVRRLGRGLKDIEKFVKQAKAGKPVDMNEVPPPVASGASGPPAPAASEPPPAKGPQTDSNAAEVKPPPRPVSEVTPELPKAVLPPPRQDKVPPSDVKVDEGNESNLKLFKERQAQYKVAALTCKRAGDIPQAKHFLGVSKEIGLLIQAAENNQTVDIAQLPSPPSLPSEGPPPVETKQSPPLPPVDVGPPVGSSQPAAESGETKKDMGPPPPPKDTMEALQQRLVKYQAAVDQAKEEENSSKARRMGRIVKQYQDAIKSYKAGRPVDFEELPTPPGYVPIPLAGQAGSVPPATTPTSQPSKPAAQAVSPQVPAHPKPAPAQAPQPSVVKPPSRNEQQFNFLVERQKEFKMAALRAKKQGDIEEARDYLRMAKGLDPMIESAQNGLKVDITGVPPSPMAHSGNPAGVSINITHSSSNDSQPTPKTPTEVAELFARLEDALIKQMEMCVKNCKHYQHLGDLANAKNFEYMAKHLRTDLDSVQSARKHKEMPPKFHYEEKSFTIVNSFPELSDSEVEIAVIRSVNIPLPSGYQPKDMYTYVTYEFPYPNPNEPQTGRTTTLKHVINPEFNESFKVSIDRKNRSLARVFKRQAVKFEVKYERGFLKGDKSIGQVLVKLALLDSKCEVHECVDLMDPEKGRKAIGGKLEVRMRVREPLSEKDVKIEKWNWLVIDVHFGARQAPDLPLGPSKVSPRPGRKAEDNNIRCVEVLKLDKQLLEKQIANYKGKGQPPPPAVTQKLRQCQQQIEQTESLLAAGDKTFLINYIRQLGIGMQQEQSNAQQASRKGDKTEAKLALTKRKLMENELNALKRKLGVS